MSKPRQRMTLALGALTILLFVALLVAVFRLRSSAGDVYAPYSTFRADPMGAMALFNALEDTEGVTAERFIRPFEELPDGNGRTLILQGASLSLDPVEAFESIEAFALQGGRVVIAFHPMTTSFELEYLRRIMSARDRMREGEDPEEPQGKGANPESADDPVGDSEEPEPEPESEPDNTIAEDDSQSDPESGDSPDGTPDESDNDTTQEDEDGLPIIAAQIDPDWIDVSERWPFSYGYEDPGDGFSVFPYADPSDADAAALWVSGLYFEASDAHWTPVYIRPGGSEERPWIAVMEREMGDGSIVLASDSYFFSNEALRNHRALHLLDWVIGASPNVLVSEVHLGTEQRERIMTLVRRYRLHGVLFGLILLGILFVWKNATTLVPRTERAPTRARRPASARERSHQEGIDNLLARFVPKERLVATCADEWLHQFHNTPRADAIGAMRETVARDAGAGGAVEAYNRMAREIRKQNNAG